MKVFSAPEKVTLNITNRCNLHCLYCAVSPTKNAPGDLSLEEWKGVVNELALIQVFHLLISGGEPFLYLDFPEILRHIFQYHFRISINTNGTLFDAEVLSLLAQSGRLDNIQVSLDGPNSEIHDVIRGKGTFEKTLEGVVLLRQWELPFSFFIVVCRNNKDHLEEMVQLSNQLGASRITFSPLLPQGSALLHFDDLFLSFEEQKKVEAEVRLLKKKYPHLVGGSLVQTIEWMDQISEIDVSKKQSKKINKITSCKGGISDCSIRPEGWVIPCDRLWEYKVGDVKEQSFQSIWLHSEGFQNFRIRYSRCMDSFKECQDCIYTDICRGGCPAIPYNTGREIEGWDPLSCYRVFIGQKKSYL